MNPFIKNKSQLSIFTTAGYPKLDSLPAQINFLEQHGVDFIEIGIPFSDPMADGPVIQSSSIRAIENGMTVELMFEQLRSVNSKVPLVIMSYLNPILCFGIEKFLANCLEVRVYHLIIPDISLEVFERDYESLFKKYNVTLCFLVTSQTPPDRLARMAEHSSNGFIYLVSSNMTTGNAKSDFQNEKYREMKSICAKTPMMIGFGIKTKEDVLKVHAIADGAIIGSAYLEALASSSQAKYIETLIS